MRIISDFKDYYDSALGFGSDPNVNYVRKEETFEFEAKSTDRKSHMPRNLDQALRVPLEVVRHIPHRIGRPRRFTPPLELPITAEIIGFCGFLYAALEIDGTTYHQPEQIPSGLSDEYLRQFGIRRKKLEELLRQKSRRSSSSRAYYGIMYPSWNAIDITYDNWTHTLKEFIGKRFDEAFVEAHVPVFRIEYVAVNTRRLPDKIRCTLNPCLRANSFEKIKPPFEAFQEISLYLGNQLARQMDPVSTIPDEILRDEKGFNEWSFRRHKDEGKRDKGQPPAS